MADFTATTASNDPRLTDHKAVENILTRYYFDPEFNVGVSFDHATGESFLFMYGYVFPEAWKIPEGMKAADFDPYGNEVYEEGAEGFEQLLQEIAPYLAEPLIIHAIGNIKCRFPLSASEWRVEPGGKEAEVSGFNHGYFDTSPVENAVPISA